MKIVRWFKNLMEGKEGCGDRGVQTYAPCQKDRYTSTKLVTTVVLD